MARPPVRQIEQNARLQPVATPVDTFVQPAPSPLRGLAEGLAKLGGPLQDMLAQRSQKQKEEDAIRGKAAIYGDHAEELAQGIRDGKIPPQYSPAFVDGFKEAQGDVAGGNLVMKFNTAWTNWADKDEATDEQYDQFLADFLKSNINSDDPRVLKGLLPQINVLENNARQMWVAHKAKVTAQGFMDTSVAGSMQDIDRYRQDGLTREDGTDYAGLWGNLQKRRDDFTSKGGSAADFDNALVEGMAAKIMETQDPQLLDFFDQTIPGTSRKYSDVPDFLKIKNATLDNLTALANQQLVKEAQTAKAERDRLKDEAVSGIIKTLDGNPDADIPEEIIQQAERNGDETIRTKLKQWREDLRPSRKADPEVVSALQQKMLDNPARAEAIFKDAVEKRIFAGDPEAFRSVASYADGLTESADVIEKSIGSNTMTKIMDSIAKRAGDKNEVGDLITGLSQDALAAQYDLKEMVKDYILANPDAKSYEIDAFISEQGAKILRNFSMPADGDPFVTPEEYKRDPNLAFDNPILDANAQDQQGTEPTAGPTANPTDKAGQPTYEGLEPDQKKAVDDLAKQRDISPQDMWNEILKSDGAVKPISYDPAQDLGEGDARSGGLTFEKANAVIEEALARAGPGGDSLSSMRQLIVQAESGGDYNAVFGRPAGSVNLAEYTLDDILREQERARARGAPSTAVGGGQFIYKTLRGLKDEMGLTGTEKFTPELQDKMIDTLLVRRGAIEFNNGRISQRQFATRLSQEWAALPNPNTGRSFYAGDGLNASRTHISKVYEAMGLTPVSYGSNDGFDQPYTGGLRFNHPEQEAGVREELKAAVASTWQDLGLGEAEVTSGHRGHNHPAERNKASGGGEHTKGNAMDISLRGKTPEQRAMIVRTLISKGVKRFITYDSSPDMLHIDLRDQTGNGSPYFMHNKSAKNLAKAPPWFKAIALGTTDI